MRKKTRKLDPEEPLFYMAFVLKGTEQQYLNLLRYIKRRNRAQMIYQCRSLTYLYITREDPQKRELAPHEVPAEMRH